MPRCGAGGIAVRVAAALGAEPGARWHERERPQTGGFGGRWESSRARREDQSRPCRLLLLLRAPAPAPAWPRGSARFLTAPAASRSSPGSRCYAPPGRPPAGIRGLSSCSQRGPAPRLCRREPLRAARPRLGTAPELRAPACCSGLLSHGAATRSRFFSREDMSGPDILLFPECRWLPRMAITLGSHSPGLCGQERSALQPPLWPPEPAPQCPPCPAAARRRSNCPGAPCRAVLCRAVPFQLDPHGIANLGNPLVTQTAVVVAQRSVQASGAGVFHLLPSWMFVPASGKFHTWGPWAFGA